MTTTDLMLTVDTDLVMGPRCHEPCVQGQGNTKHGVMVIGLAPGKEELRIGKPMVGQNGKVFNDLTAALGFPRDNMYVTNMCCWWVEGKIKKENMDQCFSRVQREIRAIKPKLIILLGSEVCQYWTDKTILHARGAVLWSSAYNCYVMPTIQPAALFHDESLGNTNVQTDRVSNSAYDIVRDLRKIPEILEWPPTKNHVPYTTIHSTAHAQQVLDALPRNQVVSIDIETNAAFVDVIDVAKDDIVCLAMSTGIDTWVGDAKHFDTCVWPLDIWWTPHYSQFDMAVIHKRYGVWLPVKEDTLLMSYSCDERPGYHGLKQLAREYEAAGFYEEKRAGSLQDLMEYNAKDAAYTARLATGKLREWQNAEGTRAMYERFLIPAVNVFKEVKARGARVDTHLLRQLEKEWGDELATEDARIKQIAYDSGWTDRGINLGSWQQLSKMLYGVIGLKGCESRCCATRATPSTDKKHLDALKGQHPFADALVSHRNLQHSYDIYVGGWVKHVRSHGLDYGRIHPDINLHGTVTGRRSYGRPAVQTIPRPSNQADKYGRLRQAIIPTDDTYEIMYADYQRSEIWTAYAYSRDPIMLDALQKDYHLETAVNVMHKDRARMMADKNYREEMRFIAKKVTFGILYGMEAYTLSQTAQIPVYEAQAYINQFFNTNTLYNEWYQNTLRTVEATGELISLTGRKRRFVMLQPNPRVLKQACNFPIQSTAGDVTLSAVIKLHEALKPYDSYILLDVHDCIVFEIAKRYRHTVIPLIIRVMEEPAFAHLGIDFPSIPVDAYVGPNWGAAKEINRNLFLEAVS